MPGLYQAQSIAGYIQDQPTSSPPSFFPAVMYPTTPLPPRMWDRQGPPSAVADGKSSHNPQPSQ
ncbi:uncharacterized protein K452DRAFT_292786 [Aplosporella prunicola CBS 121167]|uniref:Uncharacterized protein n=1 Tax=Aplosporella prunicola CBS 121167 TaxID=1176127 RepID=A0A6A6AYD7_9PEZI|nr:uncharacterized protein K452DRAFT_292786 [Aplosporella prunicola CBS 121167]KAF2135985.1 hypothetical protein K452DRAFT_292786 [Aplosporella prunicola CBS 121167]